MFCGKCGTKNEDNARFCRACGAEISANKRADGMDPVAARPVVQTGQPAAAGSVGADPMSVSAGHKHKKVGIIAVAAVVVIALVAGIAMFGGGKGYEEVADAYVEAILSMDGTQILDMVPDKVVDGLMEENGFGSNNVEGFVSSFESVIQGAMGYLENYIGVDYEITHEVAGSASLSADALARLQDEYKVYGVDVSDAKYVDVIVTITSGGESMTETITVPVMKSGGDWYLDVYSL